MGRPFIRELAELPSTFAWARAAPIGELSEAIRGGIHLPLTAIGSGGSYTAAALAALLQDDQGQYTRAATPLTFLGSQTNLDQSAVIVLSARGENSDILRAFDHAANGEPRSLLGICLAPGSSLMQHARRYEYSSVWAQQGTYGKEGFLAVNSLLAFSTLLARAYSDVAGTALALPTTLGSMPLKLEGTPLSLNASLGRGTFLALHGRWGAPAAIDLESKFSEAALGNVLVSDFRTFAHGRHNWIDKRAGETGVVLFATPEDSETAMATLDCLPESVPRILVQSGQGGSVGALALLLGTFQLTQASALSRGSDPGRPHVKAFGRRLYHLGPRAYARHQSSFEVRDAFHAAARRKAVASGENWKCESVQAKWLARAKDYFVQLARSRIGAVVMDYDGTMCAPSERFTGPSLAIATLTNRLLNAGTVIGVATRRGRSVREDLRRVVPSRLWGSVVVGYYNGSEISLLDDSNSPHREGPLEDSLVGVASRLHSSPELTDQAVIEVRPHQITLEPRSTLARRPVLESVARIAMVGQVSCVKVLSSTHTIDVVASTTSKLNVVNHCKEVSQSKGGASDLLCIGDSGSWPGNDCELLSTKFSLSVDRVSGATSSCWNLAPPGHRGTQALRDFLTRLSPTRRGLAFATTGLSRKP